MFFGLSLDEGVTLKVSFEIEIDIISPIGIFV